MTVTRSNGRVVTSDWIGGTPLGSSLHLGKARFILSLSSLPYDSLKIFIFSIFLYRVFFTSKIYVLIFL
jgi:hypothetical protein